MATQTAAGARRRFSLDDCHAMVKAGILSPDERIELRDGQPFRKDKGLRRRFSVDEYYAMAEAGILAPDERVELLAGEIITMAAIGSHHAFCVTQLTELFYESLGRRVTLRVQNPVRLAMGNEPEPDVALVQRRSDNYASAHPGPDDIILIVEVADASAGFDRRHKLPLYALYGIPETWLFDINARQVEIYDEPMAGGYARVRVVARDGTLTPQSFPDVIIPVSAVMPE